MLLKEGPFCSAELLVRNLENIRSDITLSYTICCHPSYHPTMDVVHCVHTLVCTVYTHASMSCIVVYLESWYVIKNNVLILTPPRYPEQRTWKLLTYRNLHKVSLLAILRPFLLLLPSKWRTPASAGSVFYQKEGLERPRYVQRHSNNEGAAAFFFFSGIFSYTPKGPYVRPASCYLSYLIVSASLIEHM